MIASVNLDVSIVNVTNESMASWRKKGRERERVRQRCTYRGRMEKVERRERNGFFFNTRPCVKL